MINPTLIDIPPEFLRQIKLPMAYPLLENIILSDEQIKEFCVYPAYEAYFTKFPVEEEYEQFVTGGVEVTIDFPDEDTFGVLDARFVDKAGRATGSASGASYLSLIRWQNSPAYQSSYRGTLGTGLNFNGLNQAYQAQEQFRDSWIEHYNSSYIRPNYQTRKIELYTNMTSTFYVMWAKTSNHWKDIRWQFQRDVIKLAQSHLLRHLSDFASIESNSEQAINVETDKLKEKADELKEEVMSKWNEIPDMITFNLN